MFESSGFRAVHLGLEPGLDRKPDFGGIRAEPVRFISGDFAQQRNIPAKRNADHRIPFTAIADAQPRRTEIMVDQPENCPFQRPVPAQSVPKIGIDITQAIWSPSRRSNPIFAVTGPATRPASASK